MFLHIIRWYTGTMYIRQVQIIAVSIRTAADIS